MRVCILGDGLSSLSLAKALVNLKINVDLVGEKKNSNINKTRTIGISKSNVDFYNTNIIDIKKIIWKVKKIEIFTDNFHNEKIVNFENDKTYLFSIVKNYHLISILKKSLKKNKYLRKIHMPSHYYFYKDYDLVINTYNNNFITKKFFNKKITKKYNSRAHTTIFKHKKILNNIATQIFTKKGPLAFLPISNYETSIVYSIHNLSNKKTENIKDLIKYYNKKYKIRKIQKIEKFDLKSITLRSYYYENILAFGDLLHKIHPLAGQGFNMTIRDIMILMEIIKNKISLGLPFDKSVNVEFEKKLKHKNLIFSNGIDLIYEIFNFERKTKNSILSKSIKIFGKNSYINKMFTKIADKGIVI